MICRYIACRSYRRALRAGRQWRPPSPQRTLHATARRRRKAHARVRCASAAAAVAVVLGGATRWQRVRARFAAREAATPASPRSARHPPPLVWDDCPPFPWDAATAEKFLATYWQKAPCLLRGAGDCAALEALLTPYERPGAEKGSRESRSYDVGALAADAAAAVGGEAAHRARCVALGGAAVIGRTRTQF